MKEKLVAFIRETSFLDVNFDLSGYIFEHGTHNGYVAVPPENRYHGRSWKDIATLNYIPERLLPGCRYRKWRNRDEAKEN